MLLRRGAKLFFTVTRHISRSHGKNLVFNPNRAFPDCNLNLNSMVAMKFVNKFNFSKHDVTMVSGSHATVHTCNDYRGSNVRSFCWVHYWTSTATCVPDLMEQSKKMPELAELFCHTDNRRWLQILWSSQTENDSYIPNFIIISNIFEFQYNFI